MTDTSHLIDEKMRADFEKDWPQGFYNPADDRTERGYADQETHCMWIGWKRANTHYAPKITEAEAVEIMIKAYWGTPITNFEHLTEDFKNEMRAGMRDVIKALAATGVRFADDTNVASKIQSSEG